MKSLLRKGKYVKRLLGLILAFTMMFSMVASVPGLNSVLADSGNVSLTVHFMKPDSWSSTINAYVWAEDGTTLNGSWPGSAISENADHAGWYDLVLEGYVDTEVNFIFNDGTNQTGDLSNEGKVGKDELWVVGDVVYDQECWDGVISGDLTVHFLKPDAWSKVNAYVWVGDTTLNGSWPGSAISENADHTGWYDLVLEEKANSAVNFIFNDGSNQTDDLTNSGNLGATELWVVGTDATVLTAAPESWNGGSVEDPEEPSDALTVHFMKPSDWGTTINAYVWDNSNQLFGGWPGTAISENESHTGWYDAVIEGYVDSVVNFIFNDGTNQTADLSNDGKLGKTELWVIAADSTVLEEAPDSWVQTGVSPYYTDDCLKVQVDDEEPVTMEVFKNGVFETTVNVEAGDHSVTLLVNDEKTEEITVTADAAKEVVLRVDEEGTFAEAGKATLNLVGTLDSLGFDNASWNVASTEFDLEYIGNGLYQRILEFAALEDAVELEYKVAYDHAWDRSLGDGSSNIQVTIPAGTTKFAVYVDETNQVVYDSIRTNSTFATTVSFIGDARGIGGDDWTASLKGYEFDQISETLYRYQKTFEAGTYNYKCVFNYSSWYETEGTGNQSFTLTAPTHVVFLYDAATGYLKDSVNEAEEVGQLLNMKVRPAKMGVVDNANGTTTFVVAANKGDTVALYYADKAAVEANGESAFTKVDVAITTDGMNSTDALFLGDDALDIVYYYEINGVRTLDTSNQTVTVNDAEYSNYTREAFTGRLVCVPGTFPGPSWDAASNEMTYEGNGLYSYTFEDVPAANYEYKIAMGAWGENYGANGTPDGSNIAVAVPTQQDVTIWYNDFSHNSVNSIDYEFVEITLSGTGIPEGTKLTDEALTGIYSVTVPLVAGTYSDIKLTYNGEEYAFAEFELSADKDVTFYMDPATELYYHNGSDAKIETDKIVYDSQDEFYKSVFGAVATGEEVTFRIKTGADVQKATLIVKGAGNYPMTIESDESEDGKTFAVAVNGFANIGEYDYYFALSDGGAVVVYGDDDGYYGEGTVTDLTNVQPYDLVVYKEGYETPDWMKNAVIYQIFPDRFYDGDESNNDDQTHARGAVDYEYIADWYTLPENPEQEALLDEATYKATGAYYGDGEWSNEIYGGDLQGIIEKIDYLKALGVNVIYLNPVFASISNHRYDTSDYTEIDPILGTEGDFAELVRVAEENDMHIILDGVFNHVSDDSIYFDRYYRYLGTSEKIGTYPYWAYVYDLVNEEGYEQADAEEAAKAYFTEEYGITDYSYTEWVTVENKFMTDSDGIVTTDSVGLRAGKGVYTYEGWWGYDSMPVIKSTNGSEYQTGNWAEEIIYNKDATSVTQYWISKGNNGWRLDVANEVSDETWQKFRESVKALDSDAVIIGEIWDDATKYLKGDMYDSVMNYLFRNAVTSFAMGTNAEDTTKAMEKIRERYPEEAFYAMMNLVGSHDTTRVLSYLDGIGDDRSDTSLAAAFPTWESTSVLAKDRQKLVAFLQFTYAGAPTIYYGDEIGMVGSDDPDDRRAFEWGKGDRETVEWYAKLAAIRAKYSALRTGSVEVFDTDDANVMGYVRRDDANALIVVANNASSSKEVVLNMTALAVEGETFKDLVTDTTYTVGAAGTITVDVDALRGAILVEPSAAVTIEVGSALAEAYDSAYIVAEREAVPPTDAEALTAAITKAEALVADNYTEESWAAVEAALEAAKAVAENEAATQDEIDEATAALNDAMDALVAVEPIVVDKSALSAAIQEAEALKADDYTEESWAAVEEALADAKEVYDNAEATQEEVDAATAALNDAMDALAKPAETVKPTWKSWLDKIFGGWFDDDDDTNEPDQPVEPDQPENPDQPDEPVEPEEPSKPSWGGMFDWIFSWWK